MDYPWPGNVRQLKNIAKRYVLKVGPMQNIPSLLGQTDDATGILTTTSGLTERVEQFETQVITHALKKHKGNIAETLKELQLPRRTLNNKMNQYLIKRKDYL